MFHSLRHTALTALTVQGVDTVAAKIIAGHRQSDEMLQTYYAHHGVEDLRASVNRIRYPLLDRFLD